MTRLITAILEIVNSLLKRRKSKEEKEKDNFDETLAENDHDGMSGDLSDSLDRVHQEKGRRHP